MAKAPKCKLCGQAHWLSEPHVFDGPARPLTVASEKEAPLTTTEANRLRALEYLIEPRVRDWLIVADALSEIRDKRLYRVEAATFDDYCQSRWGITRQRVSQLTQGAKVVTLLTNRGLPAPHNEGVARALAPLNGDPKEQSAAWSETVAAHGPTPTAAETAQVVSTHVEHGETQQDATDRVAPLSEQASERRPDSPLQPASTTAPAASPPEAPDHGEAQPGTTAPRPAAPPPTWADAHPLDDPADHEGPPDAFDTVALDLAFEDAAVALVALNDLIVAAPPPAGTDAAEAWQAADAIAKMARTIADRLL